MTGKSNHACRGCRQAVPKSELMRLMPCRCVLCKDCLIEFLFAVCSKKLDLECCACRQAVTSLHVTECQPTCRSPQHSATTKTDGKIKFSKDNDQSSDEENKAAANTNKKKREANEESENRKVKKRKHNRNKSPNHDESTDEEDERENDKIKNDGLKWQAKFGQLKAYKERFGDCLVPSKWSEIRSLSSWVTNQRSLNNKGLLRPERKEELDAIGFAWKSNNDRIIKEGRKWKEKIEELKAYKERFGDCLVPWNWPENKKLPEWVTNQRRLYNQGKLGLDRKQELDAIGFVWKTQNERIMKADQKWTEKVEQLKSYKERFGDCMVPWHWKENQKLSVWVTNQRSLNRQGKLGPDRKQELNAMGFSWHGRVIRQKKAKDDKTGGETKSCVKKPRLTFEQYFESLLLYKSRHGTCRVKYTDKEFSPLCRWSYELRTGKREITEEQRKQLIELGFDFEIKKQLTFDDRMTDLQSFKARHGHCRVPFGWKEDKGLAAWVKDVRRGSVKITYEQRRRLNEINFVWETAKNRCSREWKAQFDKLIAYKARYGDCMVPWNWKEDRRFSNWVHTQRKKNAKGIIFPDRKELLESIGFAWRGRGPGRGNLSASGNRNDHKSQQSTTVTYEADDDDGDDDDDDDDEDNDLESEDDHNYNIQWDNSHWQNAVQQGFVAATEYHPIGI